MNKLMISPLTTGCWLHKSAGLLQLQLRIFFLFSGKGQPVNLSTMLEEKLEAISLIYGCPSMCECWYFSPELSRFVLYAA